MGDNATSQQQQPSAAADHKPPHPAQRQKAAPRPKKEVRILMLHGYTQSGPLFRAKVRALEKMLAKALAPLNLVPALLYPTAPERLSPRDIPGYQPSEGADESEETDSWAWFRKDEASGNYRLVDRGMVRIAESMAEAIPPPQPQAVAEGGNSGEQKVESTEETGVIDGVVGFSQGGCMAAMLASAMEPDRTVSSPEDEEWVKAVRDANKGQPLKFAVSYSGFWAVPERLGWLYEPKIKTPTLHILGSLDTVVEESRSQGLVERCEEPLVVTHPGGHYVPVNKEWVMPLVGFVRKCLEEEK